MIDIFYSILLVALAALVFLGGVWVIAAWWSKWLRR